MSRAYWMLGGQQLSAHQFEEARKSFEAAAKLADQAGVPTEDLLARAFAALVTVVETKGTQGESELQKAIEALAAVEGGPDFVPQVKTARTVFLNSLKQGE